MNYRISISYSPEDETYIARVPALPGCVADGETPEDAAREIGIALQGHLDARAAQGMPIPEDPMLHRLREVSGLLNISELAREAGISKHTLRTKLQRGTVFSPEESARLVNVLEAKGVDLVHV